MKKAFTLAEVMITLVVIGIITAVIIPVAIHSKPDENVMKFKKAHNTLYQVISTLVNSDKYYLDGDMTRDAKGNLQYSSNYDSTCKYCSYFCNSIADILSVRENNCNYYSEQPTKDFHFVGDYNGGAYATNNTSNKIIVDYACKKEISAAKNKAIILSDGIVFYETGETTFAYCWDGCNPDTHQVPKDDKKIERGDFNSGWYKIFCIDIDGVSNNATEDDCINECPFGYGIRYDGKILTGKRADEWLEKSIQGEE